MNTPPKIKLGAPKKARTKKKISLTLYESELEAVMKITGEKFGATSLSDAVGKAMEILIQNEAEGDYEKRPLRIGRRTVKPKGSDTPRA